MLLTIFFTMSLGANASDLEDISSDIERLKVELDQEYNIQANLSLTKDIYADANGVEQSSDDNFQLLKLKGQNAARLKKIFSQKNKVQKLNRGRGPNSDKSNKKNN